MKLATYTTASNQNPRVGVVVDDEVVDLGSCGDFPSDMKALLAAGVDTAGIEAVLGNGERTALADVQLHAPVVNPGKILAIGLNYGDHIEETGSEAPCVETFKIQV